MQINNYDNATAVVIVHLAYYIYSLLLPSCRPVHKVQKKRQIRNLCICVRVRCAVTIVSKWPLRSLTITDPPDPISMRGTINYVCIYTRLMQTHARTHVCEVSRHGAVCQQWLISICIPEFRLDPET